MHDSIGQGSQPKTWQPLRLLSRFRARVTALSRWDDALPVHRDGEEFREIAEQTPALAQYACDVACVCPDAAPAQTLVTDAMQRAACAVERNVLAEVHQRLGTIHSIATSLPHRFQIARMIEEASGAHELSRETKDGLLELMSGPLIEALYREQAIAWLLEAGVKVNLYGEGWGNFPQLRPYAHYFSGTDDELLIISRMAKINLRVTRCAANEPLMAGGIRAGGFFLMRFFPEDVIERIARPLHEFCCTRKITSDAELRQRATDGLRRLIEFADLTLGVSVFDAYPNLVKALGRMAEEGFARMPGG